MLASKQTVVILNILRRKVISSVYSYIRIFHKIEENNNNLTPNVVPCLEPAGLSANDTTIMIDQQAPGRELRWVIIFSMVRHAFSIATTNSSLWRMLGVIAEFGVLAKTFFLLCDEISI